ncbi:MAG TPA: hypothetical protein VE912_25275, partial [Bacteroidales bacterium]|nr:hypothetical protein [Bacteroidales bacterium]
MKSIQRVLLVLLAGSLQFITCIAQPIEGFLFAPGNGLAINGVVLHDGKSMHLDSQLPFFSVIVNGHNYQTSAAISVESKTENKFYLTRNVTFKYSLKAHPDGYVLADIVLQNNADDTVSCTGFLPFGRSNDHVYIISDSHTRDKNAELYRPGKGSVEVSLPYNSS